MDKQLYNIIRKCNVNILPIHISYRYIYMLHVYYGAVINIYYNRYLLPRTIRIICK